MQLANMQDIGGCRSVLRSIDEVRRVQRRLVRNRPPIRVTNYIDEPRDSGYRGVHVIVEYDGRAIEVQLRAGIRRPEDDRDRPHRLGLARDGQAHPRELLRRQRLRLQVPRRHLNYSRPVRVHAPRVGLQGASA